MLRDIRDLTDEREGYSDELRQGVSSHVMFLARGKAGPAGAVAVRVVLHDEGNGDKAITSGSYLFRTETQR
jgi:hypothetical protein